MADKQKYYKVGADGKAPKGLKSGDQVVTGGGTWRIDSVREDGSYASTLVDKKSERSDIQAVYVPVTGLANENDLMGFANVIMLGTILKKTGIFGIDEFEEYLVGSIPPARAALIEKNKKALRIGWEYEA